MASEQPGNGDNVRAHVLALLCDGIRPLLQVSLLTPTFKHTFLHPSTPNLHPKHRRLGLLSKCVRITLLVRSCVCFSRLSRVYSDPNWAGIGAVGCRMGANMISFYGSVAAIYTTGCIYLVYKIKSTSDEFFIKCEIMDVSFKSQH